MPGLHRVQLGQWLLVARSVPAGAERLLRGAVRPLRRGERGERLTADARALTCSQCPVSKGLFGPIPKRTSDCCWPEVVSAPDGDDIAWFASTLEDVADGVGRADYEPTGLLGTGACSYCPRQGIPWPHRRLREAVQWTPADGG